MAKDVRIAIQLGATRLLVDSAQMSYEKVCLLAEKVAEVRAKNSLFEKYPLEEDESKEDWAKRIEPLMQAELTRKVGETHEDHVKRIYGASVDGHKIAFGIMNAIGEVLCNKSVSPEDFRQCNWVAAQQFIYDVCSLGMIDCQDFFPRRPSNI